MKKTYYIFGIIILVSISIFIGHPQQTERKITVGVILPLSGQYSAIGESDRNAMLLAQKNQKEDINLIFEDDEYDTKKGVSAYNKLVHLDKVDALVILSAPVLEAIEPLAAKDNILVFSLGESLFHKDDTVFQLMPAGDLIYTKLGEIYAQKHDSIALVHGVGSLWKLNNDLFIKGLPPQEFFTSYQVGDHADYRTIIQKILASGADSISLFLPLEDGLRFAKNLVELDVDNQLDIICDINMQYQIQAYEDILGRSRLDQCVTTGLPNTMSETFTNQYVQTYKSDPFITSDYAYDSMAIIAELSLEEKPEQWSQRLKQDYQYVGASGTYTFNPLGTREASVALFQYMDGEFTEI